MKSLDLGIKLGFINSHLASIKKCIGTFMSSKIEYLGIKNMEELKTMLQTDLQVQIEKLALYIKVAIPIKR